MFLLGKSLADLTGGLMEGFIEDNNNLCWVLSGSEQSCLLRARASWRKPINLTRPGTVKTRWGQTFPEHMS